MPISLLPELFLLIFAVGYSPGPANIYSLSCVLSCGRKKAMVAWIGLVCGWTVAALISATLMHLVGMALADYVVYIKYIGAAYMLYLAYRMYRSTMSKSKNGVGSSFWDGFIVQFTNAKMILFELTVYSGFVLPYSEKYIDILLVATLIFIAGPLANLVWLLVGSFISPLFDKYHKQVNIVMAIALVCCAYLIAR